MKRVLSIFEKTKYKYIADQISWATQRQEEGVADPDIWNFDMYLAAVIATGLRKIAKDERRLSADRDNQFIMEVLQTARLFEDLYVALFDKADLTHQEMEELKDNAMEGLKNVYLRLWT